MRLISGGFGRQASKTTPHKKFCTTSVHSRSGAKPYYKRIGRVRDKEG